MKCKYDLDNRLWINYRHRNGRKERMHERREVCTCLAFEFHFASEVLSAQINFRNIFVFSASKRSFNIILHFTLVCEWVRFNILNFRQYYCKGRIINSYAISTLINQCTLWLTIICVWTPNGWFISKCQLCVRYQRQLMAHLNANHVLLRGNGGKLCLYMIRRQRWWRCWRNLLARWKEI